jgi:hypothetical protein
MKNRIITNGMILIFLCYMALGFIIAYYLDKEIDIAFPKSNELLNRTVKLQWMSGYLL